MVVSVRGLAPGAGVALGGGRGRSRLHRLHSSAATGADDGLESDAVSAVFPQRQRYRVVRSAKSRASVSQMGASLGKRRGCLIFLGRAISLYPRFAPAHATVLFGQRRQGAR